MSDNLIVPLLVRITSEDQAHLENLAKIAQCTVPQLARYYVRVGIYKQLEESRKQAGA
jgi:hypothetical protein